MKRKVLCSILAILIILASVPMTAFAADAVKITKVDLTATKNLIEGYNCHIEYDGNTGEPFNYYYLNDTLPNMTLTFSDGSTKDITFDEYWDYFEDPIWCEQGAGEKELKAGTHTKTVCLTYGYNEETQQGEGVMAEYTFTVEENPIESISVVATKPLIENKDGYWENKIETDENGNNVVVGRTFFYYVTKTEPTVTIRYKNGETGIYPYGTMLDETGYDLMLIDKNNHDDPYKLGEDNVAKASVLGVEAEFSFAIIPNPVKKVEVRATKDLVENRDGIINGENVGESYFYYYIQKIQPEFTVTFTDGTVKVYRYDELNDSDYVCGYYVEQGPDNQLNVGTHTAKANFNGIETTFTFKIVENPVKNIVATPTRDLVEYVDGYSREGSDGEMYFWYDVISTRPNITINYKDGTSKIYTYAEFERFTEYGIFKGDNQDSNSQLKVGANKMILNFGNFKTEYTFNVKKAEKTVTSISVVPEGKLIENIDGSMATDNDDKEYFIYNVNALTYTVTIKYSDGTTVTEKGVKPYQKVDGSDFDIYFTCKDSNSKYNVGLNTAVAYYKNATCTFQVEVVKNDYNAIEISGDNEFILAFIKQDGTREVYTAKDFSVYAGGEDFISGILTTDKGEKYIRFAYKLNEYGTSHTDITATIGESENTLKSNTLDSNKWLDMVLGVERISGMAATYADGYSKHIFGREFEGINGAITGSMVDDALTLCTVAKKIGEFKNIGEDEKGHYAILSLEEALVLLGLYFDPLKVDITTSPMYNAPAKEIKVYFLFYPEGHGANCCLKYVNGKFIYTADWSSYYTDKVTPVTVVLSNIGYVERIYFSKCVYGTDLGHIYNAGIVTTAATCTVNGVKTYTCVGCGETKEEIIPATGHITTLVGNKPATFEADGHTGNEVCTVCNQTINTGSVIPKLTLNTPTVTGTVTNAGIQVNWNAVENAQSYVIYRSQYNPSTKKWSGWSKIQTGYTETNYVDGTVVLGTNYRYTVRAVNGSVMSSYTSSATIKYNVTPTVKVANATNGIKVAWSTAANATGYTVYRSTYSNGKWSGWKNMGTAKANKTAWTDKNVKSGVAYKYTVRAAYGKVLSSYNKNGASVVFLNTPTVKIANNASGIKVAWNKIAGAQGYVIYSSQYDPTTNSWSKWANRGTVNANSWIDTYAQSGVTYKYTVRALNGKSLSAYVSSGALMYLAQPTVKIANAQAGINVSWSQSAGALGYTVYRSEYDAKTKKWSSWKNRGTATADKSSWVDKKVTSGKYYKYTVRAINGNTKSTYVSSKSLYYLAEPVTTVTVVDNGINVAWTQCAGAKGYTVYSSQYDPATNTWSNWINRGTAKANKNNWTDTKAVQGVTYKYAVRAVNGKLKSSYTETAGVTR